MQTDIYLANKIKGADRADGIDFWKTSKIKGCEYKTDNRGQVSERVSKNSMTFTLLIPFTGRYTHYEAFKRSIKGYSMSVGDYIYLNKPSEQITANNAVKMHHNFSDTSFQVQSFNEVQKRSGVTYQLKVVG